MKSHASFAPVWALLFALLCSAPGAQELRPVALPPPRTQGGKPFMETVQLRRTIREIKPGELSPQVLGDLLWTAYGINRPDINHRTAPSAMNSQEVDIYVATAQGLYLYEPKPHRLAPVLDRDLRAKTSGQAFGTNAPVTLIFVADTSRLDKARPDTRLIYANFDAGCICQNVYLFCASEGLATVVHDLDRGPLVKAMNLRPEQNIIMAQAVGYPQEDRSTPPK
jgi:nitroreductase